MKTIETKLCSLIRGGCGITKRINQFHINKNNNDGHCNICNECLCKLKLLQKKEIEKNKSLKNEIINRFFYRFIRINPKAAKKVTHNEK